MQKSVEKMRNKLYYTIIGLIAVNVVFTGMILTEVKNINKQNDTEIVDEYEVVETTVITDLAGNKIVVPKSEIYDTTTSEPEVIYYAQTEVEETESTSSDKVLLDTISNTSEMIIPDYDTYFKSYMDYKYITNTSSKQYKLQQSAWTDDCGLRRYNSDYMVAMGSYYGEVGDRFKVTLENDIEFTVIMGDSKADIHTDNKNMYRAVYDENGKFIAANVLEFIVDTPSMSRKVKNLGTVSGYSHLTGNIVKIEKIGGVK